MGKKLAVDGWTVNEIMELYVSNKIFVDQKYQRKLVWSLRDKQLFIDSLIKKFPIPNIMMVEYSKNEENSYGIIDGLQRVNAIVSFMLGEFSIDVNGEKGYFNVTATPVTFDLYQEGKLIQKEPVLDKQICVEFRGYKLPIIATSYDTQTIDEIFKRLNSTGTKLSRHDLRQAGSLNKFSQAVREISSIVRGGKTLSDIVTLNNMPKISLSNSGLNYGINIENVFWKKHGILTDDLLRKSRDEEIIAILLGAFLLERQVAVISPNVLDNLYDSTTEDGKIVNQKIKKCYDNIITLFVQVFNELNMIYDETRVSVSEMLFANDTKKTDIFMLFFKVMLQIYFEGKAIGEYEEFVKTLKNSKKSIFDKYNERTSLGYLHENNTVRLISDLIRSHLVEVDNSGNSLVKEVVARLNLASIETQYTEYKIGFTFFNTDERYKHNEGKLNFRNVSQIAKVASAMTNTERNPEKSGMIIVGVADNEKAYRVWAKHFGTRAYSYNTHRVVGVDAEAKVRYKTVDNLMRTFKERVDMEPISDELKENLKNYQIISIQKKTLIVFTITAESGQLYDGKKYIREGSDLKEICE